MSSTVPSDLEDDDKGCWRNISRGLGPAATMGFVAQREVPVEGLMFSPFDLVFGRNIKGVLQLIKNSWINHNKPEKVRSQNVIDYILQLRDRICSSFEIVNANEEIAKKRSKVWYDRNTKPVSYKEGELVPLIGKPLQAKFSGPCVIE